MKHRRFDSYLTHHSLRNRFKNPHKPPFISSDFRVSEKELYYAFVLESAYRASSNLAIIVGSNPTESTIYAPMMKLVRT